MLQEPLKCLVVDDDPQLRDALRRVLESSGYEVLVAPSGRVALEVLDQGGGVPLVVSDIRMPEMDGFTLLRRIREKWPDIAVVMVTAVTEVDVAVACLKLGALDYILKPFQIEEVSARADQALDKRRLILENRDYQEHLAEKVQQQAQMIEELYLEGVQTLVEALEAKDAYTSGHSSRVAVYSSGIADQLSLNERDIRLTALGAELHDVGKIGVHESVLMKPGKLEPHEYEHLMEHTVIGARILDPLLKRFPEILSVVRSHHERLDGAGLPDGLKGDAIPIHTRVVTVADSFDAMTSARPYRPALDAQEAIAELHRCRGTQFDPDAVAAFLQAYPDWEDLPIRTPRKVRRSLPDGVATTEVAPG
ncbi:MAG: response regulator [Gemmatimonadota bacterium]|nr:MAG: response regulator [Gemmatimonadota bacterium]